MLVNGLPTHGGMTVYPAGTAMKTIPLVQHTRGSRPPPTRGERGVQRRFFAQAANSGVRAIALYGSIVASLAGSNSTLNAFS